MAKIVDDREEFSAVELVTGLLMALRMRGVKALPLDRYTEEAIVAVAENFTRELEDEGYWISYYLAVNSIYGGSGSVNEAFRQPSVNIWLKRWTGQREVEIDVAPSEAMKVLQRMVGPAQRWVDLASRFLAERERLSSSRQS